ncbi:hypothetical protein KL925_003567 [Ogataea polymorpha]|nr:hypothetical protein KL936_003514 [Ogataea polymorpha]KAG7926517.1 hypothetical protein KL925_003567 [Ogataea polymorpha]
MEVPTRRRRQSSVGKINLGDNSVPSLRTMHSDKDVKTTAQLHKQQLNKATDSSDDLAVLDKIWVSVKILSYRHPWLPPLVVLVATQLAYWFSNNYTPSNPLHMFMTMSYRVPGTNPPLYEKGWKDFAFVGYMMGVQDQTVHGADILDVLLRRERPAGAVRDETNADVVLQHQGVLRKLPAPGEFLPVQVLLSGTGGVLGAAERGADLAAGKAPQRLQGACVPPCRDNAADWPVVQVQLHLDGNCRVHHDGHFGLLPGHVQDTQLPGLGARGPVFLPVCGRLDLPQTLAQLPDSVVGAHRVPHRGAVHSQLRHAAVQVLDLAADRVCADLRAPARQPVLADAHSENHVPVRVSERGRGRAV